MIFHHHPSVKHVEQAVEAVDSLLSVHMVLTLVCSACALGLLWALINYFAIRAIDVQSKTKSGIT
jgi:hypothetical protein